MKTFMDRLRECPIEILKDKIKSQKAEAKMTQRYLDIMERVLMERERKEGDDGNDKN